MVEENSCGREGQEGERTRVSESGRGRTRVSSLGGINPKSRSRMVLHIKCVLTESG